MTGRRPSDAMGARLWELEEGYCGESEHVDDLITLAWNIYHARDEARRANERLAGEARELRMALEWYANPRTWKAGVSSVPEGGRGVSVMSWMSRPIDWDGGGVARASLAAAPPPATEGDGGGEG